jgi:hypothetical protein
MSLTAWKYYSDVDISNSNSYTIYRVKINLDSSNFDFSLANNDGSDIRFSEDNGNTTIPYRLESWDNSGQTATVWIKISGISANDSKTIRMYYGNTNAASESNGDNVFEFFDDFEGSSLDTNKWGDSNGVSLSGGICKIQGDSDNDEKGIKTANTFSQNIEINMKAQRSSATADLDPVIWFADVDIHYASYLNPNDINGLSLWVTENDGWGGIWLDKTQVSTIADWTNTNWCIQKFAPKSGNLRGEVCGVSGSSTATHSYDNQFITIAINSGDSAYLNIDWVFVKEYVDQEPTYTIGSTQIATWGNIIWFGANF